MSTSTSGKCEWKRRCGNNEYAIPFQDLKIVKQSLEKLKRTLESQLILNLGIPPLLLA